MGMVAAVSSPGNAATFTLTPVHDTFVQQTQPNTNYGASTQLATGFAFPGTESWVTYLQFDLSSLPSGESIQAATLSLYQVNGGGFTPIGTNLHRIDNDAWSEATLTAATQPALGTLLGSSADGFDHRGWSSWNLFDRNAWDPSTDQADGLLSLQLFETLGGTQSHNYCSKESGLTDCLAPGEVGPASALRWPVLVITTVPEPAAALLVAVGVAGTIALVRATRRRTSPSRG